MHRKCCIGLALLGLVVISSDCAQILGNDKDYGCIPAYQCNGECMEMSSDPSNCGSCSHNCEGGACEQSVCAPVTLANRGSFLGIAADVGNIYWVDEGKGGALDGAIMIMPVSGGQPTVLASGQDQPSSIALGATNVYWTNRGSNPSKGAVMMMPLTGGTPVMLAADPGQPDKILVVDDVYVYWISVAEDAVKRANLTGANPVTMIFNQYVIGGIAVDKTSLYWTSEGETPGHGMLMKISINGGNLTTLATGLYKAGPVAVDAENVYWLQSEGAVRKQPVNGGNITALNSLPSGDGCEAKVLVIAGSSLLIDSGSAIQKVSKDGLGSRADLASISCGGDSPRGLAVSGTTVYWTSANGVMKTGI